MGDLFFTYYETSPDMRFYLCKYCFTHIAVEQDTVCFMKVEIPPSLTGVFETAVNLWIDTPEKHTNDNNCVVGAVFCIGCNISLGWKHVRVPPPEFDRSHVYKEGRLSLDLSRMNFWNGFQMLDATTMTPL